MSIELHCPSCNRLIRAPDGAGGRKGKCPHCQNKVYIPTVVSDDDVIPIAPLDPEFEAHEAQLRRESASYAASIDKAVDAPRSDSARGKGGGSFQSGGQAPMQSVDVRSAVSAFVRAMHESNLDEADRIVERLRKAGTRGRDDVQRLMTDQIPTEVEGVAPPLVKGFLKSLLGRLESE